MRARDRVTNAAEVLATLPTFAVAALVVTTAGTMSLLYVGVAIGCSTLSDGLGLRGCTRTSKRNWNSGGGS